MHGRDVVLEPGEVGLADGKRRHARDKAFQRIAHLVRIRQRRLLREAPRLRGHRLRAFHIDALAGPDHQQAERFERGQRLAQRSAADLQFLGKLTLRRQQTAHRIDARFDPFANGRDGGVGDGVRGVFHRNSLESVVRPALYYAYRTLSRHIFAHSRYDPKRLEKQRVNTVP
ncbi:hypothetical protein GGD41_001142 [Paraburkholderia bryophila]|uniref:Uncharacterized protein n=1 Tax=Paraburkholderia bryophila TaxID=420952 RepID=A0A7Y9W497_9BURK|nr:hypothetical protein [Paraburkholderia bryophila]